MEFKYRANDNRPTTPMTTSPPISTVTYITEPALRGAGGFASMFPSQNVFRMPVGNGASEALRRELEKEQIRREIIAGEILRRRELEEEVRRELALERELGLQMQRSLITPTPQGFSFQEERMPMSRVNSIDEIIAVPLPQQLPQIMAPPEINPSPKDQVIILAKPDPDQYDSKKKEATPTVYGSMQSPLALKKKPKEEWSCSLCQISATNEKGLNEHFLGKKHKAKEAALSTQKIGLDAKADSQSLEGSKESKTEELKSGDLENKNETATEEAGKTNALKRKKVDFWCEVCQIGTWSQIVMESHKRGKKHLRRMMTFDGNNVNGSALLTSTASKAPVLVKDTDDSVKSATTPVVNEETDLKVAENIADSDEVHPVAESGGDVMVEEGL
ncbi:Zinc finger C2H2-type [Sesbania bispinosa]|nr:Zinc finger C2H2-type [Sesbania bispinosa]